MAKKEHLAQLKQGLHAWYRWREAYPDIAPDLRGADLRDARLRGMNPRGANLSRAHLDEAELIEVDLRVVDLREANLARADLRGVTLAGADLREAIFSKARLGWADLAGARIGWTTFGDTDLGMARGLETVRHIGPSTIGIDTLYRSGGNIPEVFLRGAGVPNEMITYSKSLVGQPFQYYSCFISYSRHDEALAQRLHADLRDQGVRGWFAPEDLKIGDEFRSRIDESIQVYDRLLLILSE